MNSTNSRYFVKIDSKVFKELQHLSEVNLLCEEILSESNDSNDSRMNSENSEFGDNSEISRMAQSIRVKYPPAIDQWSCCENTWARYSDIVIHVEKVHLPYVLSHSNGAFKHTCSSCHSLFVDYNGLITHFLKQHITQRMLCLQCNNIFEKIEDYCAHARNCNPLMKWI